MGYIPNPFKRPAVSIDDVVSRKWSHTFAGNLADGDTVQDKGTIAGMVKSVETAQVTIQYVSGNVEVYRMDWVLYAFTEATPVGISK